MFFEYFLVTEFEVFMIDHTIDKAILGINVLLAKMVYLKKEFKCLCLH